MLQVLQQYQLTIGPFNQGDVAKGLKDLLDGNHLMRLAVIGRTRIDHLEPKNLQNRLVDTIQIRTPPNQRPSGPSNNQ